MTQPADDPRPPYRQAADELRREITSGKLRPGDRLPSSRELQARFAVANMTVQSALRVLRDEGLIYTVQGRGSYVRDHAAPASGRETAKAEMAEQPSPEFVALSQQLASISERLATVLDRLGHLEDSVYGDQPRQERR